MSSRWTFPSIGQFMVIYLLSLLPCGRGGYLNVQMDGATQCGHSTVQWSGDDGPYHLLLTPTEFSQHGYNVWLPSISNGTSSFNLSINQPQGLQFILTMWGASGIAYAGTTDILTVGPPVNNRTDCFFTDEEILGLYSFSFNISNTYDGYPPQCANMTMSWPTSLESNVTGSSNASTSSGSTSSMALETRGNLTSDDKSSSTNKGNTTYPPTMFGVIPLGNSFNIPITYDSASEFSQYLPPSSVSDDPTTWTSNGVTYLNWTVPLAKGTRFILVAGIGSDQKWASGGSSQLLTVGQGMTDCVFSNGGDPTPSVTATTGTYTGGAPANTNTTSTGSAASTGGSAASSGSTSPVKTILACVFSVLATLLIVGVCIFCRKAHKRRKEASKAAYTPYVSGTGSRKSNRNPLDPFDPDGTDQDLPLDLVTSRSDSRVVHPILTDSGTRGDRPASAAALGASDTRRLMDGITPPHSANRSYTTMTSPPTSPTPIAHDMLDDTGRQSSLDHLLSPASPTSNPPAGTGTFNTASGGTVSTHRPLMLHDRTMGLPLDLDEDEDVSDLKRETLAMQEAGPSGSGARRPQTAQRRRRAEDLEYVVHRDAGRVRDNQEDGRTVLELPPRYEELNWDDAEGADPSAGNLVEIPPDNIDTQRHRGLPLGDH